MAAIVLITLLSPWKTPTPDAVVQGRAKYYDPGLMETVAANRGVDLTGYVGGVSLMAHGDLYREVWVTHEGETLGPFLVIDCVERIHYDRRIA